MIRFHTYFGYKLCEYPIKVYDPVLNKKLLLECLKWYLSCYDSLDQYTGILKETIDLSLSVAAIDFTSDGPETKCDRILMESLYILCNLDDVHPMFRYWNLRKEIKSEPSLKLAYNIALANFNGNYIRVCKQLENLCPLTYCALCLHLPRLQRCALQVMSVAYNKLAVPTRALRDWLRFNSADEARQACRHYGLAAESETVKFIKGDFRADAALMIVACEAFHWLSVLDDWGGEEVNRPLDS
ncbi:hypothetical protein MSG28_003686 [Choristoneura fumiferana]|uniref:Uncharacterized protein n=1 Tax=Choristoneura fumiferana TaxID=7141 RepID=A0ACC0KFS8_CHOFU|nr:hypothetical protein MSG28_003686 [Choristoneura fumiferana]